MNNIWSETSDKSRAKNFWEKRPYTKEFRYKVQMTMDECLTRLYHLQPSRTVSITQNANQAQFEICVKHYDNRFRFQYNSAVAYGIVRALPDHPEMMIIAGIVRYKIIFWLYLFVLAMFTFMAAFTGYIIFGLLGLLLCLVFIRRDYNDYQQLCISLHDTFIQEQNAS